MAKTGTVLQVQRFSLHDGPGIRTTVFIKGCPLRCRWCHNPESFAQAPQIGYEESKCAACGGCVAVCQAGAHSVKGGRHSVRGNCCTACGQCAGQCPTGALQLWGGTMATDEVLAEALKDRHFYGESGGGITLSGGEPALQPGFTLELLAMAKAQGLHTCLETCGHAPWEFYSKAAELTDLFLYDYKLTDPLQHRKYTGVDNGLILDNLRRLSAGGNAILLRCPIIPGVNDNTAHFAAIRALCKALPGIKGVQSMPYHKIGAGKWRQLGLPYALEELPAPGEADKARWQAAMEYSRTASCKEDFT